MDCLRNSEETPGLYDGEISCIMVFMYFNFSFTERTRDIRWNIPWKDPRAFTEADLGRAVLELLPNILKEHGDSSLFPLANPGSEVGQEGRICGVDIRHNDTMERL